MVGKGLEVFIVVRLLVYTAATLVPMAMPLAVLLASLMTFGALGEKYELVAMKAAGISLWRVMRPLIVFSVLLSTVAFYFSNNVLPYATLKAKTMLSDVQTKSPAFSLQQGVFNKSIRNYVIHVGKKDDNTGVIRNITIYDHSKGGGNTTVTRAESGVIQTTEDGMYCVLELQNGFSYDENTSIGSDSKQRVTTIRFDKQCYRFDMSGLKFSASDEGEMKDHYEAQNLSRLNYIIDSLDRQDRADKIELIESALAEYRYLNLFLNDSTPAMEVPASFWESQMAQLDEEQKEKQLHQAGELLYADQNSHNFEVKSIWDSKQRQFRYEIEWQRKFSLSISCLLMFFVAASFGSIVRRGGLGFPLVITVVIFLLFWIISMMGERTVREGVMPAYIGMWISSAVLLCIGVFLTAKATTDSPLLDREAWQRAWNKLKQRKK